MLKKVNFRDILLLNFFEFNLIFNPRTSFCEFFFASKMTGTPLITQLFSSSHFKFFKMVAILTFYTTSFLAKHDSFPEDKIWKYNFAR